MATPKGFNPHGLDDVTFRRQSGIWSLNSKKKAPEPYLNEKNMYSEMSMATSETV